LIAAEIADISSLPLLIALCYSSFAYCAWRLFSTANSDHILPLCGSPWQGSHGTLFCHFLRGTDACFFLTIIFLHYGDRKYRNECAIF